MKSKLLISSVTIAAGVLVWMKALTVPSSSVPEKHLKLVHENVETIDDKAMFSEFERLKSQADSRAHYQDDVAAAKVKAVEYAEISQAIHHERELLLKGKAIVDGLVTLTDEERSTLEELNKRAGRAQQKFLISYQSIKR